MPRATFEFEVKASHVFEPALDINWYTETGTAAAATDYKFGNNEISFNAAHMEHTIKVTVLTGNVVRGAEEFTVPLLACQMDRFRFTGDKSAGIGRFNSDS
jgi:hypothetical protein